MRWSCAQAYAGLDRPAADHEAARVGDSGCFRVICTPSGGSQSVEIELGAGWERSLSDEELLHAIRAVQA